MESTVCKCRGDHIFLSWVPHLPHPYSVQSAEAWNIFPTILFIPSSLPSSPHSLSSFNISPPVHPSPTFSQFLTASTTRSFLPYWHYLVHFSVCFSASLPQNLKCHVFQCLQNNVSSLSQTVLHPQSLPPSSKLEPVILFSPPVGFVLIQYILKAYRRVHGYIFSNCKRFQSSFLWLHLPDVLS